MQLKPSSVDQDRRGSAEAASPAPLLTEVVVDQYTGEKHFTVKEAAALLSISAQSVYQMCKIGKLSFVAGAEIPRKYLV